MERRLGGETGVQARDYGGPKAHGDRRALHGSCLSHLTRLQGMGQQDQPTTLLFALLGGLENTQLE